ncbi:hypothetical protein CHN50_10885 [Priestia aryabhattai]|uniref:ABC transporter permease n=1 Tax=Bacillaceae TaxID=186817 RepID=UPI000B9FD656|nr:ABC transporter permease [Bacillus sp. CBEL-1]OZT12410.1 hypothetical protein CHN50_10885 [Priestia aryabhattai]TDB55252.1 ABC transporter permease [Bacillus sp. CBEL-1]
MFFALLKKQFIQFVRRPQELIILLLMPFVLIVILGFSLGSIMSDKPGFEATIGIVVKGDEEQEIENFKEELAQQALPEEAKKQMLATVNHMKPIEFLLQNTFQHKEVMQFIKVKHLSNKELEKAKRSNEYNVIIVFPKGFSYEVLQKQFFNKDFENPPLTIIRNEDKSIGADTATSIMEAYQQRLSLYTYASQVNPEKASNIEIAGSLGEKETANKEKPISALAYYAIGMSMMFVLYIAPSLATNAYVEKEAHSLSRIILANVSPTLYYFSIFCTGFLLALCQLLILYSLVAICFGVIWSNLLGFIIITVSVSMAVGGISACLSSVVHRLNSEDMVSIFRNVVVTILAFLGGSFFPTEQLSSQLATIGGIVPNGAGTQAYLRVLQGESIQNIRGELFTLFVTTVVMFSTVWLFGRKGWKR